MKPWLCAAGTQLRDQIDTWFPDRSTKSPEGWLGDSRHSARKSDHNPDANGWVRAVDINSRLESSDSLAHYLADQIVTHVANRQAPRITISDEREMLLDSGGGILKALHHFGDAPFFSLNADTIWIDGPRNNLQRMMEHFDPARSDILLLVAPTVTTIGWGNRGDFVMAQDGTLRRPAPGEVAPFAYTGAAILKPESFAGKSGIFSLNRLFNEAAEQGRLHGLRLDGVFMHVGTPHALADAERALAIYDR